MVKEVKKALDLPSTNSTTGKTSGIFQFEPEGLRIRSRVGELIVYSPDVSPTTREPGAPISKSRTRWISQLKQRECGFTLSSPLCSVWTLDRLDDAHLLWEGPSALLSSQIRMLISF